MLMVDIKNTPEYFQLLQEELKLLEPDSSKSQIKKARMRAKKKAKRILDKKRRKENIKERKERSRRDNKRKFGTSIIRTTSNLDKSDIPQAQRDAFYQTQEWKDARDEWKVGKDQVCAECGRRPDPNYKKAKIDRNRPQEEKEFLYREFNNNRLLVDHILPIKTYWRLRLDKNNFQYLCGTCNEEKSNTITWKNAKKVLGNVNRVEIVKVQSNG